MYVDFLLLSERGFSSWLWNIYIYIYIYIYEGLAKFDPTREHDTTQHGFCGFGLSIIVFGSYSF